jgi:hypothetical protein
LPYGALNSYLLGKCSTMPPVPLYIFCTPNSPSHFQTIWRLLPHSVTTVFQNSYLSPFCSHQQFYSLYSDSSLLLESLNLFFISFQLNLS